MIWLTTKILSDLSQAPAHVHMLYANISANEPLCVGVCVCVCWGCVIWKRGRLNNAWVAGQCIAICFKEAFLSAIIRLNPTLVCLEWAGHARDLSTLQGFGPRGTGVRAHGYMFNIGMYNAAHTDALVQPHTHTRKRQKRCCSYTAAGFRKDNESRRKEK